MQKTWWKESVVYQIYPRSFNDSNGDGIGDINGIINKLDYIKSLGIDVIWLCPVYESPNDDNGYDISNYRAIMKEFGTMTEFDTLLMEIHKRGLKLVMDLVANHTSDEHYWFQEARKSKENPYHDYYIWKSGKNGNPPNNWKAFFGGSVWQYNSNTDEYYMHFFSKKQPDLNWENPKVRQEIYDIIKFWFEKGVNGFRMDVISLISKQLDFPDADTDNYVEVINKYYANGPKIHKYLKEMNATVLSKYDIMTVGEGPGINLENGLQYVDASENELNMIFHFDHMFIDAGPGGKYDTIPIDLVKFKNIFNQWDNKLKNKGWGSIFLGNHDFSRIVSRFGNDSIYRTESAKLLATLLLSLRGTVYIYQGEEIGMTNVAFSSIEDYNDIETLNAYNEGKKQGKNMDDVMKNIHMQSRDNARTPMHWDSGSNASFTSGKPWIKMNPNYTKINVENQLNYEGSILSYYKRMIQFRKENPVLVYGDYECIDLLNQYTYAYRRWDESTEFLIIHNFSDNKLLWETSIKTENYTLVKSNIDKSNQLFELLPWQSKILKKQ